LTVSLALQRVRGLLRPRSDRIVVGMVAVFLLCIWGFVVFWSLWEHASILASSEVKLQHLNNAVQQQTKALFVQAETSLAVAKHWMEQHPDQDPGKTNDFIELVETLRQKSDGLIDIRMVTKDGILRYIPDRGQTNYVKVDDRDYFRAQLDARTRGLFFANPLVSRVTGKWGIPVSLPVEGAGGNVGVIFAAIELDKIAASLEGQRLMPSGAISITRNDGVLLFRIPMIEGAIGKSIADSPGWQEHLGVQSQGAYISNKGSVDGTQRMISFARVPGYPLLTAVTQQTSDMLDPWALHTAILAAVAGLISAFAWGIGAMVVRSMASENAAKSELEHLLLTDSLTNVGNRRFLTRRLDEEVMRAQRYGRALTVVFFDLDYFKEVNDQYGHQAGDVVLQRVAQCLSSNIRSSDHIARFGGEEFVVLLTETGIDDALAQVERMREAVANLEFTEPPVRIRVSAGLAQWMDSETGDSLLQRSDRALYRAKAEGRNRACLDRPDLRGS